MQQARDFLEESRDLFALIGPLDDEQLSAPTGFKSWTIEQIVRHLHFWNRMALFALTDGEHFKQQLAPVMQGMQSGNSLPEIELGQIEATGRALVADWREAFEVLAEAYNQADPSQRCTWAGPSMSARSCITARQMETWAHGQAVYDELGRERVDTDRLRNVVVLGVNTYGWTFQVRSQAAPEPVPHVDLEAPSGERWQYGEPQQTNCIRGSAVEFAQVVTQTRNIADTHLVVTGEPATLWMANAQCFFGGPTAPPAAGTRKRRTV